MTTYICDDPVADLKSCLRCPAWDDEKSGSTGPVKPYLVPLFVIEAAMAEIESLRRDIKLLRTVSKFKELRPHGDAKYGRTKL